MPFDVAAERLRNQRLMRTAIGDPAGVVQWLGAVQAQEYAAARWGLGLRGAGFSDADVEDAFNRGAILRTHVLRPTWHFVTPADIRWMLALTGPRVERVCSSYYRKMEIDAAQFARSAQAIEGALAGGRACTRRELGAALSRAGIEARLQRLAFFTIQAELEGIICSGPRRGNDFTYALLEERVPRAAKLSEDEALAELTRRYFASHGPATIRDFSWWSGLTRGTIKRGIEMVGGALSTLQADGLECWFVEGSRVRSSLKPTAHLLPIYDEFLIAYQDRGFLKRDSTTPRIYSGPDTFTHHLVIDGRLAGRWKPLQKGSALTVAVATYGRVSRAEREAIHAAAARYGKFVGGPVVIRVDPTA